MKAEKRHQLQRNVLADRVGRLFETMKSSPRSSSTLIWAFIIVTLATLILWQYGAHANQSRYSVLWTQVDVAGRDWERGPTYLKDISDDSRGSLPGRSARFQLARFQFSEGQKGIRSFLERTRAVEDLKFARSNYAKLMDDCLDAPLLAQEAMMGVAQAEESLVGVPKSSDSSEVFALDQALGSYQKLADKYPDSILGKQAAERIKAINEHRPEIEKFYAELNHWATKPAMDLPETLGKPEAKPSSNETTPKTAPGATKDQNKFPPIPNTKPPESGGKHKGKPAPLENKGATPKTDGKSATAKADDKGSKSR
jgi:hypothetical protein